MVSLYVSPADKLARQILKQIERSVDDVTLDTVLGWHLADDDQVSAAVAHAREVGWLIEKQGVFGLTLAGAGIAKRTRVGAKKRRRM
jgi:hypothetical protein